MKKELTGYIAKATVKGDLAKFYAAKFSVWFIDGGGRYSFVSTKETEIKELLTAFQNRKPVKVTFEVEE